MNSLMATHPLLNNNNQKPVSDTISTTSRQQQESCHGLLLDSLAGDSNGLLSHHAGNQVDKDTVVCEVATADCNMFGCASVSNSYCLEWDKLFATSDYLKKLRSLSMHGNLRSSRFRSICWKLFLEVLPEKQSQWISRTDEWRKQYEELKNQLIVNPRNAEAKDLNINNPLSQEVESPWNQFFLDNELRLTIKQDVVRTFPEIAFFKDSSVRDMLTDILFCYARSHSSLSYVQGMHELLAPLIFILHCDHQAFLHACEIESVRNFDSYQRDLTKHLLDPRYLEHDAYSLFYQIMETVEPWYVSKEIIPDIQRPGVLCSKPFTRPADIHPSNVIVTKLTRIQDYLLKRFDIELHERLQSMDIVPQIYGIRWVRLLFGREFPMQDLLMLWDAIFADGISFDLVDYVFVAMLLYIRDAMLTSDYASCLHLLMKYPPIADIQYFIDKALYLREPNELPRPPEYQYQKPAQFGGINGWTASSMLTAGRMTNRATGSLGSSISRGLSTLQRPGSLVIAGSTQISKSTSEPMNLITDTAVSPQSAPGDFQDDPFARKLSTASLSHIELALNQSRAPGTASTGLRTNTSTQSLIQVDGWRTSDDQTVVVTTATTGESVISPPTSSRTGSSKFFMFGGTRSARKSASKQKQQKNGMDADGSRPMTSVIVGSDSLCRRCATELDIHIGTLQRHLLKQDHHGDDEVLLALAGIKQVRDVLKGVLKPSCLLDCAETESVPGTSSAGWYSNTVSASGVRRQHSEGSAQSSLSTTPVHDVSARNRFYIATPDLLSSDTDVTSPENLFLGAAAGIGIMGRNDGVALVGGVRDSDQLTAALELSGNVLDCEVVDDCSGDGSRGRRSSEVTAAALPYGYRGRQLEQPFSPSHTCGYMSGDNGYPNTPDGCRQDRKLHLVTCHAGTADAEGVTEMVNSGSKSVDVPQQTTTVSGGRLRVNNEPIAAPTHKQGATGPRDSSPINRLAGLFRNFPKF